MIPLREYYAIYGIDYKPFEEWSFYDIGFLSTFSFAFLASSFIKGSPILNDCNYSKQFWIEFIIIAYASFGIISLWCKKVSLKFHLTLADAIVIILIIIYSVFVLYQGANPLVKDLPFYYILYYLVSKLLISNQEQLSFEVSIRFFLVIIPLVIIAHVAIIILQLGHIFTSLNDNFEIGGTFGNPEHVRILFSCFNAILFYASPFMEDSWVCCISD